MAQMILSEAGGRIGGPIGRAVGGALGRGLDRAAVNRLSPARQVGPRLETLRIQGTAEGSPMACSFGRARVTGQVIWAARFREARHERRAGKGGPRTVEHSYSLSFAVAVCEGPIDGFGRVWADGRPMDLRGVTWRAYHGDEDQTADPLIEAVEGSAPAYRGTAYVVFEDLALDGFGDRVPQLSFEVFRRPEAGLETKIEGVCLIPGAGEFALADTVVLRRDGMTRTTPENQHHADGRADLTVSLDQLAAQAPNLKRVSLVIGWFGDDLRAGHCRIRPGVERRDKATEPIAWRVAGLDRAQARLISRIEDRPAYGGTPSDDSVRQAIAALKARGWAVTLYPFVFMDVAPGNGLSDPYGEAEQAPHPWRGRIVGRDGVHAQADVDALFGGDWGLRRLALHYAAMAADTGCDGLLIGSEMRGLTGTRDASGGHPAVEAFRALAAECRGVVGPEIALSYAADWSEYANHRPGDGTVTFHLDPLWADPNIDYVGIDWYAPLGDWREGDGGRDAAEARGASDKGYLARQVAGGEGFDWFYANAQDRAAQRRTPIVDTAHGEDWVFRVKDLKAWWSNLHHDRPGGARATRPTAWVPGMKPIRLTEFGCAAVDRGGNAPNLFQDPKSAESALPPHSDGGRDDTMQRRAIEAVIDHFAEPANNPVSAAYGGPMLMGADVWCWDARPYPAFPAMEDVWADCGAWRTGHWLNGRLSGDGAGILRAVLSRAGVNDAEIGTPAVDVRGYVIDRPMSTRDALEPLLLAMDMVPGERGGRIALIGAEATVAEIAGEDRALDDEGPGVTRERRLEPVPGMVRVRHIDEGADYQTGAILERATGEGGAVDLDLPAVCEPGVARTVARRLLDPAEAETRVVRLNPFQALELEAGDRVTLAGEARAWRIARLDLDERPRATLTPAISAARVEDGTVWRPGEPPATVGRPVAVLLDLPPLPGREGDDRPWVAASAEPWAPMRLWGGAGPDALTSRAEIARPATAVRLTAALSPGVVGRWDETSTIELEIEGRAPEARTDAAVLDGANALAIETEAGWEIVQFARAEPVTPGVWRLSRLLRAQQGTEAATRAGASAGARAVVIDDTLVPIDLSPGERGVERLWRCGPADRSPGGPEFAQTTVTLDGRHHRPWAPAHVRIEREDGVVTVRWTPRVRLDGDGWDREPVEVDPRRFRLRVTRDGVEVHAVEVEGLSHVLAADAATGTVSVAVAQYGPGHGWGDEAIATG